MKKIFIIISCLVLALVLIIGFIAFNTSLIKEPGKKKLTFWSIQLKPIYEKEINEVIDEFVNLHPDYKVVWVDIPIQEAQKRTLASVLSSSPPDLINLNPDFSIILAQKNTLHFFNNDEVEQFHPSLVEKLKYDNKIYALPFYATSPVTLYNKEIYSKCAGNEFIKSYDELFKLAKEIKNCSNMPIYTASINENDSFAKMLNKYNVSSFLNYNEKSNSAELFNQFNRMYKENNLPKDILSINHREAVEKYMSGNALIIVAGSNFIKMIKQNAPDIYSKTAISKQLTGANGKYDIALMNLVIPKKSANIKEATEFALLLTDKAHQMKLAKITNVIPANKYALEDEYFKNCSDDVIEKSRCISANQLNNINQITFGNKNKNLINENINKTLEEILLNKDSDLNFIKSKIESLSENIQELQK